MNERIKELANIAAGRSIKTSPAVASDMADWAVIEKFAELIVRKCVGIVKEYSEDGPHCQCQMIKQHFGVEE